MADALMGITEVTDASKAEIGSMVQSFLVEQSMLLPTVTDYSSFIQPGMKSFAVPRSGGFTVGDKAENTAVDSQIVTYAADTISMENHRVVQFLLEDYADIQANIPVVQDAVMKASKGLAVDVDAFLVAELKKASASAPDHQVVFADTTNDVIALADVLAAKALLQTQYIDFSECWIGVGPEKENELLGLDQFINNYQWGTSEPLHNGVIGKIYGAKVIVSSLFEDFMCTWHPSAVGFGFQRAINFDTQKDLQNLAVRYSLDMIHGAEVLDSGVRTVLTDSTN